MKHAGAVIVVMKIYFVVIVTLFCAFDNCLHCFMTALPCLASPRPDSQQSRLASDSPILRRPRSRENCLITRINKQQTTTLNSGQGNRCM